MRSTARSCASLPTGRPLFYDWLYGRGEPRFLAFDLLWLDGEHQRSLPLIERKERLRKLVGGFKKSRLLLSDYIEGKGRKVFEAVCALDLEGIVAKRRHAPYIADGKRSSWIKIKNPNYSGGRRTARTVRKDARCCSCCRWMR